jgi:hypothetical protein
MPAPFVTQTLFDYTFASHLHSRSLTVYLTCQLYHFCARRFFYRFIDRFFESELVCDGACPL